MKNADTIKYTFGLSCVSAISRSFRSLVFFSQKVKAIGNTVVYKKTTPRKAMKLLGVKNEKNNGNGAVKYSSKNNRKGKNTG